MHGYIYLTSRSTEPVGSILSRRTQKIKYILLSHFENDKLIRYILSRIVEWEEKTVNTVVERFLELLNVYRHSLLLVFFFLYRMSLNCAYKELP